MMSDPILLEIPDCIQTQRLTLRVPREGEGPAINRAINGTIETLRPWMMFAKTAPTMEVSESNCRKARAKFILREDLIYRVYLKDGQTMIGSAGLHNVDWSVPRFEIGYWISKDHEGRGYATEVARALAEFAFGTLKALRVEIRVDTRNLPSQRVAKKVGFTLEGTLRKFQRGVNEELCDMKVYAKIVEEAQ